MNLEYDQVALLKYLIDNIDSSRLILKEKDGVSFYLLYEVDWESKHWEGNTKNISENNPSKLFF